MPEKTLTEEKVREIMQEELGNFILSDRYLFEKKIQIANGQNIQTGRTIGTKIGIAADNLLSFFGVTPVNQPETVADPAISSVSGSGADATINTNFINLENAVEAIIDRLQELGLIK